MLVPEHVYGALDDARNEKLAQIDGHEQQYARYDHGGVFLYVRKQEG
jgi:hypothetical protein